MLIVRVEVAEAVLGVVEAGENAHLAPEGSPAVHDSVTMPLKLFVPVTRIWSLAGFPAETVTLLGLPEIVKLGAKTTWVRASEVLAAKLESPP